MKNYTRTDDEAFDDLLSKLTAEEDVGLPEGGKARDAYAAGKLGVTYADLKRLDVEEHPTVALDLDELSPRAFLVKYGAAIRAARWGAL